jgi:Holliday junction DNA helicase RuvA
MIVGIEGSIQKKDVTYIDIKTSSGLVYRVFVSVNCYSSIKEEKVTLKTTAIYKEDNISLYGFIDENEQLMFENLLKVKGVGPKVAMAICSTFTPLTFAKIVQEQDITSLKRVPGIGAKGAGLILVQLGSFSVDYAENSTTNSAYNEALLALESLGFKKDTIQKTLSKCKSTSTADLVKEALKYFQR